MKRAFGLLIVTLLLFSCFVAFGSEAAYVPYACVKSTTIDSVGAGGNDCFIALDSAGNPHISYMNVNGGSWTGLKYAWWDGTWHTELVEGGGTLGLNGLYSSLALDSNGNPHITYIDGGPSSHRGLMYATWDGQGWAIQTIDPTGCLYPSLALDSLGNPHISYCDSYSLKYASWNGSRWIIQTLDSGTGQRTSFYNTGIYNSLKLDSHDRPHISYYYQDFGDLKYAFWNGTWNIETVDSNGDVGADTSLVLDSNSYPHISYSADTGLKYAVWDGSNWNIEIVDTTGKPTAVVGRSSSIALDSMGRPHISYLDNYRYSILKYAYFDGSTWKFYALSAQVHAGYYTSLAIGPDDTVHLVHGDYSSRIMEYLTFNPAALPPPTPIAEPPPTPTPSPTPPPPPPPTPTPIPTPTPSPAASIPTSTSTTTQTSTLIPSTTPEIMHAPTSLELNCQGKKLSNNYGVRIEGKLSSNGKGVPNVRVELSFSVSAEEEWSSLALAQTDSNGEFAANWQLPTSDIYKVNATWSGNEMYEQADKLVSCAVTPFLDKDILSITSNSTVTGLTFDSAKMELCFMVNGTLGTAGYTQIAIAKSMVAETNALNSTLDGNRIDHTIESQGNCWLITLTYHHSNHRVIIELGSPQAPPASNINDKETETWQLIAVVAIASCAITVIAAVYRTKKHRP